MKIVVAVIGILLITAWIIEHWRLSREAKRREREQKPWWNEPDDDY